MNKFAIGLIVILSALGACTKKPESSTPADAAETAPVGPAAPEDTAKTIENLATIDPDAPAASGEERFFGKKTFTIVSKQTGAEEGDIVEHVRDWGRKRAEIKRAVMNFAGIQQATNTRTITEGAAMAMVDLDTGAVTTMENPLYDSIVARMKGKSGVEFGKEMMTSMGGRETGETGSFAGHDCAYWEVASMGAKTCVTPWGGALHMAVNMGGMSFERTATEVRLNDGGPDEAFIYDASKAQAAPDLAELMKKAREGMPQ